MATMTEPIEDDYQAASAEAERVPDTGTVPGHYRWFVNSARGDGYGSVLDRYRLAYGYGHTREEAVEDAVSKGFRAGRHNW